MNVHNAIAFAASTALASMAFAQAQPTDQQMLDRLRELESKIQVMEAANTANRTPVRDAADVARTASAVQNDAAARSASTAGIDSKGAFLRSSDGLFELRPDVQFQFRSVMNHAQEADTDGDDVSEFGFEIRRLKLGITGHAFTEDLKYTFVWVANRQGGGVTLEQANATYKFAPDWAFKFGQYKEPTFHEEINSGKRLMAADRSIANEWLGGGLTDFVQGVALIYGGMASDNPLNVELGFTDGINSDNTRAANPTLDSDWGVYARADYKLGGDWKAYSDFTAMGTTQDLAVVGGGLSYTQTGDTDLYLGTVDFQFENASGLGVFVAGLLQYIDNGDNVTNYGGVAQVSYLLPDNQNWEIFGRYSVVIFDEDVAVGGGSEDTFHEITAGVNYYFGENGKYGHKAKMTIDVGYLPNGSLEDTGLGIVESEEGQLYVRGQFQLLI